MTTNGIYLSVIIPAYNESKRIGKTLRAVRDYLSRQPYASEIIIVDDGSSDDTSYVARQYAHGMENVSILNGEPNHGKGYAVRRGMLAAKGAFRLFMDADGSVHISEVERFLKEADAGNDVVIGSIAAPGADTVIEHNGWHRRFFGSLSKFLVRALAVPGIYDTQRGFKLFTARAAEAIFPRQKINRFGFDIELLVIAREQGMKIRELPVAWNNPDGSKVQPADYFRTMRELVEIIGNRLQNAYV